MFFRNYQVPSTKDAKSLETLVFKVASDKGLGTDNGPSSLFAIGKRYVYRYVKKIIASRLID